MTNYMVNYMAINVKVLSVTSVQSVVKNISVVSAISSTKDRSVAVQSAGQQ